MAYIGRLAERQQFKYNILHSSVTIIVIVIAPVFALILPLYPLYTITQHVDLRSVMLLDVVLDWIMQRLRLEAGHQNMVEKIDQGIRTWNC